MIMDEHTCVSARADETNAEPASASMADFDETKYRPYLDGIDLDDKQKGEFLAIVWDIMRRWVEMDLPLDSCGQIIEAMIDPPPSESGDVQ